MSSERARSENPEPENPEQVVGNALSRLEGRDSEEPIASSVLKAKEFFKKTIESRPAAVASVGFSIVFKMVGGLLKFAKETVLKKGNVGFGKGYEIGKESLSFDAKKDKK